MNKRNIEFFDRQHGGQNVEMAEIDSESLVNEMPEDDSAILGDGSAALRGAEDE